MDAKWCERETQQGREKQKTKKKVLSLSSSPPSPSCHARSTGLAFCRNVHQGENGKEHNKHMRDRRLGKRTRASYKRLSRSVGSPISPFIKNTHISCEIEDFVETRILHQEKLLYTHAQKNDTRATKGRGAEHWWDVVSKAQHMTNTRATESRNEC